MISSFVTFTESVELPFISEPLAYELMAGGESLSELVSVAVVTLALVDPGVASGTSKGGSHGFN